MIEAVLRFLILELCWSFCGWVGYITVKVITLGRVNLEYGDDSAGALTAAIGFFVLLAVGILATWAF